MLIFFLFFGNDDAKYLSTKIRDTSLGVNLQCSGAWEGEGEGKEGINVELTCEDGRGKRDAVNL